VIDSEIRDLVRRVLDENNHLHGVIHCAAMIKLGFFAKASLDDFDRQYELNTRAPFHLTQLLLPALTATRGHVLFINSSAARAVPAEVTQYGATKSALRAVADGLRVECNSAGVRVCSLFLGSTATHMQADVRAQQKREYHPDQLIQPDDVAAIVEAILALPTTAEITDVMIRPAIKS
jgi:NADP-dependent 3-hydroxy acid dehydrogenase YdfG